MADNAKRKRYSPQMWDVLHYKQTEQYTRAVDALFDAATKKIANAAAKGDVDTGKPFSFADYPAVKAVMQDVTKRLAVNVNKTIETGARNEWNYACRKSDAFLSSILNTSKLQKSDLAEMQDRNLDALKAFQGRKVSGLNLSERVWNYVGQYREQIEAALDVGLGEGRSPQQLARDVKQNLKDPDRLFRRVRDKRGNLVLSKAAKAFHPGRGVYRSSVKNAQRLTRSEINMAYRESDWLRWQQLDFVVGFEVFRSNHEPLCKCDICAQLVGRYPKTFKFIGWHPQCMCYAVPVLRDFYAQDAGDDRVNRFRAALYGTEYRKYTPKNTVTDVPDGFKAWVRDHTDAQKKWASTPYFILDNFNNGSLADGLKSIVTTQTPFDIAQKRHRERTEQDVKKIQDSWLGRAKERASDFIKEVQDAGLNDVGVDISEVLNAIKGSDVDAIRSAVKALRLSVDSKVQQIKNEAKDVLGLADEWSEVDMSKLSASFEKNDYAGMFAEASKIRGEIKAMNDKLEAFQAVIPNIHDWHKRFTFQQLESTHNAVVKTLARPNWAVDKMNADSLARLKSTIQHEIDWMGRSDKGQKCATWEVSQSAYVKHLKMVEHRIEMLAVRETIKREIALLGASKSGVGKNLVAEFEALFADDDADLQRLKLISSNIKAKAVAIEKNRLRNAGIKNVGHPSSSQTNDDVRSRFVSYAKSIGIDINPKDVVVDKGFIHLQENQHELIYNALKIESAEEHNQLWYHWNAAGRHNKRGGYVRTGNSFLINKCFRESGVIGKIDRSASAKLKLFGVNADDIKTIKLLDKKIGEFSVPIPMRVTRYLQKEALPNVFGENISIDNGYDEMLLSIKNCKQIMRPDNAYMSASTNEDKNVFKDFEVKLEIEVPKGTKMYITNNYVESEVVFGRGTMLKYIDSQLVKTRDKYGYDIKQVVIRCRIDN